MYTSLKLSKLLLDNGFEGRSKNLYVRYLEEVVIVNIDYQNVGDGIVIANTYDTLNDLCLKFSKELFGEELVCQGCGVKDSPFNYCPCGSTREVKNYLYRGQYIFALLQQNKIDEAEEYIWENCLFNPKNK